MSTLSRRQFLISTTLGAAGVALLTTRGRAAKADPGRVRIGCQANCFPIKQGDFPALLATLPKMKALGYEGFECNVRFVQEQFGRATEVRKQFEDSGVEFVSVHMGVTQPKTGEFAKWVDGIKAMGGSGFVVSGAGAFATQKANQEGWAKKAAALQDLARIAQQGGMRVSYHNHNPEFADHNAEITYLADSTDPALVWFLMDAGHAHLGGGDPAAFMAKYSKRIWGCHLKTFKGGQKNQVPLGQGDWGFEDLAAAVKKTGWTGWMLTEEGGSTSHPATDALGSDREYMRRLFGV